MTITIYSNSYYIKPVRTIEPNQACVYDQK